MNKKFLSIATSLLLALPMTVAAAPSPTTETTIEAGENAGVVVVSSREEAENLNQPAVFVTDSNVVDGSVARSIAQNDLTNPVKHVEFDIDANSLAKTRGLNVTLTVKLSKQIPSDKVGYVYHVSANGIKRVGTCPAGAVSVTVTINTADLSPFVVVIGDAKNTNQGGQGGNNQGGQGGQTPNTSDSNKSILWGSIAMISLASAAGIVIAKRRNA
jgi:hypothetical protein